MNHFIQKTMKSAGRVSTIITIACSIAGTLIGQSVFAAPSAPAENTTATITRTAASPAQVSTTLSKNLFRTESYQEPYIEKVPYQETETYTVDVPYQVQVPYTDYEIRYRDEYVCHDRTRYREECNYEQNCYLVPGSGGQNCRQVTECGTNAHGEQICKTREVCENREPERRCENKRVCRNVPYTDRECNYERRSYQEPVTKYRTETRYKKETRTRTVTKYRDEQRCCVTKTRQVFDQQLQFQVNVNFPAAATLLGSEMEKVLIQLTSAQPVAVSVQTQSAIYGYAVSNSSVSGSIVNVDLVMTPKVTATNGGESSIKSVRVVYSNQIQKFTVTVDDSIIDSPVAGRLQTVGMIEVRDLATDALIEEQPVAQLMNGKKGIVLNTILPADSKLKAILKVTRSGILVENGSLSFQKVVIYEKKALQPEDVKGLSDAKLVSLTAGNTDGQNATMNLVDASEEFADISTQYNITIMELLAGDKRTTLATTSLTRDQVKAANNELHLAELLGAKAASSLKPGKTLRLHIDVVRISESSLVKSPVKMTAKASIKIK